MNMTKFSNNHDPDYRNVLSELRRLVEISTPQSRSPTHLIPTGSTRRQKNKGGESRNKSDLEGDQHQTVVHMESSPKQAS